MEVPSPLSRASMASGVVVLRDIDAEEAVLERAADGGLEFALGLFLEVEVFQAGETLLDLVEREVGRERLGFHCDQSFSVGVASDTPNRSDGSRHSLAIPATFPHINSQFPLDHVTYVTNVVVVAVVISDVHPRT